jgi:hypothetical protein
VRVKLAAGPWFGAFLAASALAWAQEAPLPPRPERMQEPAPRAPANASKDFVRIAFNFYDQDDGGGNPHLDERMTVLEPQLLISWTFSERWHASFKFQGDIISAASVESGKRFRVGQSGASGDKYTGGELGAFYAWSDHTTIGASVSLASEYDYKSVGGSLSWSHTTSDKNDTFVLRLGATSDTLDIIRWTGMEEGTDSRTSIGLGVGWTHVLGPRTIGTLNWDLTSQSGFLSTPYSSVVAAGTEVEEVLPDSRFRNAFHTRVRHLLWHDLAVEPGVGLYFDDWGATAWNFEFHAYWEAAPNALIVRPSYRFHGQSEVDDFLEDTATSIPKFRTQDSDLADFTSHTFGLKLLFPHLRLMGQEHELEIGFEYTLRSDDLDAVSFTFGWQWRY